MEEPFELRSFGGEPTLADKVRKICLAPSTTCPTAFEQLRKTCPPSSSARKAHISAHSGSNPIISQQYTKRFATSEGAFLVSPELEQSTWCDQPDLQDLHAAYIHPLSFTYTNQPFPVFGNSKIGGFDDILIPSWWYWFQVSQYQASADVEWEQKSDKVRDGPWLVGKTFPDVVLLSNSSSGEAATPAATRSLSTSKAGSALAQSVNPTSLPPGRTLPPSSSPTPTAAPFRPPSLPTR